MLFDDILSLVRGWSKARIVSVSRLWEIRSRVGPVAEGAFVCYVGEGSRAWRKREGVHKHDVRKGTFPPNVLISCVCGVCGHRVTPCGYVKRWGRRICWRKSANVGAHNHAEEGTTVRKLGAIRGVAGIAKEDDFLREG